jgi:hypothetical protein
MGWPRRILSGSAVSPSDHPLARVRGSLGRIDPRVEWPHGLVRLGVVACVAVTVTLGLVYFVKAVDRLGGDASRNAAASFEDRELGGADALGVDKSALYEARAWIPEDGTYRVVVGRNEANPTEADARIGAYARYFLMPRRPDVDASWVLCYRCDVSSVGGKLEIVWQNDAGIALGRLTG